MGIKYIASESLLFPASDTSSDMKLNFMGLVGVDSPLPQGVIQSSGLLKLINNQFYILFYRAVIQNNNIKNYFGYLKSSFGISRENLTKNLKLYLGDIINIKIHEFAPVWIKADYRNIRLGEMVLGSKYLDRTSKIIIELGPMDFEQSQYYRKDKLLEKLIHENISSHVNYKLKFIIIPRREDHVVIGQWIMH